jgi:hypothetical protein
MATARLTFGSILATVNTTANTITATLDAASSGVGMLNAFVDNAAKHQKARIAVDNEDFIENLIRDKSRERTASTLEVQKFIAQSPEHAEAYKSAYETYTAILRPAKQG